jgi:hypothetical protein
MSLPSLEAECSTSWIDWENTSARAPAEKPCTRWFSYRDIFVGSILEAPCLDAGSMQEPTFRHIVFVVDAGLNSSMQEK